MIIGGDKSVYQQQKLTRQAAVPQEKPANLDTDGFVRTSVPEEGQMKEWTVINLMGTDCNLQKFQLQNIDTMEKGKKTDMHVLAWTDVGDKPDALEGKWSGTRTFYVGNDNTENVINSPVVEEFKKSVNTVDPAVLKDAIVRLATRFPSKHIAVLFNDHGGGFTGLMSDDTNGKGSISVPNRASKIIAEANKELETLGLGTIEFVADDACLMAAHENVTELAKDVGADGKPKVKVFAGSQETEGGKGITYDNVLLKEGTSLPQPAGKRKPTFDANVLNAMSQQLSSRAGLTAERLGEIMVKANAMDQESIPTYSATKLENVPELNKKIDGFAEAINKTGDLQTVKDAIINSQNYGQGWAPYGDMHDLHSIASAVAEKSSDPALKKAAAEIVEPGLWNSVVYANESEPTKYSGSHGLHIYAPLDAAFGDNYKELAFAKDHPAWMSAIERIQKELPGGGGGNKNIMPGGRSSDDNLNFWTDGSPRS